MAGAVIELAGCIVLDPKKRILLIHRNTRKLIHWELPGGKVELNETPKMAAIRELREELGIHARGLQEVGDVTFKERRKTYHYTWFLAEAIDGIPAVQEHDKHDDAQHFDTDDMQRLTLSSNVSLLTGAISSGALQL